MSEIGWYVSDTHCVRAIGYLGAKLAEKGHLDHGFEQPLLLEFWGEALEMTRDTRERSPRGAGFDDARARELKEAAEEATKLRDLLTDVWNACRPRGPILTVAEERVWARVDYVVHEGSYGWATDTDDPVVKDLDRRVRRIEEILHRAAVTTTREV